VSITFKHVKDNELPTLEVWHTGGGCMAYQLMLPDGGYLMITAMDEAELPADDARSVAVGRYDSDGQCVPADDSVATVPCSLLTVHIDRERGRPWSLVAAEYANGWYLYAHREGKVWDIENAPRQALIDYCVWNDPNGCFTDDDVKLEFGQSNGWTDEELREIVRKMGEER
jgi:hypothetical protein